MTPSTSTAVVDISTVSTEIPHARSGHIRADTGGPMNKTAIVIGCGGTIGGAWIVAAPDTARRSLAAAEAIS